MKAELSLVAVAEHQNDSIEQKQQHVRRAPFSSTGAVTRSKQRENVCAVIESAASSSKAATRMFVLL